MLSREWVRVGWALAYYYTFTWCGQPVLQLPEDLVRFQEVVASLRPDVIIETGIHLGGSLLFHATLCEAVGNGRVIGIDQRIDLETRHALSRHRLSHRITMIEGDSTAPATVTQVRSLVRDGESVLVILDSDHACVHVARELEAYAPLVTAGSCIIAADGIMCDLADVPGGDPSWLNDNPTTAARHFLSAHPEFEMRPPAWRINRGTVRNSITYWPDGWLWRKA
jgi:cephalosporin hydroxylase